MSYDQNLDDYHYKTITAIPDRAPDAKSATDFITSIGPVPRLPTREEMIFAELSQGNVPTWLRTFKAVEVEWNGHKATLWVSRDCLCIGSDDDWCRMPMNPLIAQRVADIWGCSLITKKTGMDLWKAADVKLEPYPWGAPYDDDMFAVHRIPEQNKRILEGRAKPGEPLYIRGLLEQLPTDGGNWPLIAGHHKDVVLTPHLIGRAGWLALWGWIQHNGVPIQGERVDAHEVTYDDYSHSIRFVAQDVWVTPAGEDSRYMKYADLLADKTLYGLVSDEGVSLFAKYPVSA